MENKLNFGYRQGAAWCNMINGANWAPNNYYVFFEYVNSIFLSYDKFFRRKDNDIHIYILNFLFQNAICIYVLTLCAFY